MGIFNFFKKKNRKQIEEKKIETSIDKSLWTGHDFEFLIIGDIDINEENYDKIMTPNSLVWTKYEKDDWPYYKVGNDEFSYSWEIPGIQMTFNSEISFLKAKQIADEVIENIKSNGQNAELVIIEKTKIYRFN